jgi:hypothetical protein
MILNMKKRKKKVQLIRNLFELKENEYNIRIFKEFNHMFAIFLVDYNLQNLTFELIRNRS